MKMNLDIERLKEDADPLTVAEAIDMDIESHGRRISVLCPAHNDTNHGSCFLTKNGYRCYSCGESNDVIDMVRRKKKIGFIEAVNLIACLYGGEEQYLSDGPATYRALVPNQSECKLIGIVNQPAYMLIGESYSDKADYSRGLLRTELIPASLREARPRYRIYQMVENNPLRALKRLDEERYSQLILERCEASLKTLSHFMEVLKDPAKAVNQKESAARAAALGSISQGQAVLGVQQIIDEVCAIALKYTGTNLSSGSEDRGSTALLTMIALANTAFLRGGDAPF